MGNEEFGIRVDKIKEIIQMVEITAIPETLEYVKGVINLRGNVIPVVDLALKLGVSQNGANAKNKCIIITEMPGSQALAGIIADSVLDIAFIQGQDIDDAVNHFQADYIFGMAKTDRGISILLDINHTLIPEEIIAGSQFSPEDTSE